MISMIYDSRAIPVYFELLPKLGCSVWLSKKEYFLKYYHYSKISTDYLGRWGNVAVELANWLRASEVYFCLRLKE